MSIWKIALVAIALAGVPATYLGYQHLTSCACGTDCPCGGDCPCDH
jgi:hypothetical protein